MVGRVVLVMALGVDEREEMARCLAVLTLPGHVGMWCEVGGGDVVRLMDVCTGYCTLCARMGWRGHRQA